MAIKFELDPTGQYLIKDRSLVNVFNNADEAVTSVSNFYEKLEATDPASPHFIWIDELIYNFAAIKVTLNEVRLKTTVYDNTDFVHLEKQLEKLKTQSTALNLNLEPLKAYLSFGIEP